MKKCRFTSIQMTNFIGKQLFILQEAAQKIWATSHHYNIKFNSFLA